MSKHPRYARFHKADLQLQTPADRHYWVGAKTRLTPAAGDDQLAQAVTAYVDRLYEVGLEIVGITDHNLGGHLGIRFLERLLEELSNQAGQRGRCITVFPGFEVVARISGRVHLLCLFEPGTPVAEVSDVLTLLGLPPAKRDRGSAIGRGLDDVLNLVGQHEGIVIAAHADRRNGTLDDRQMAEVLQQEVMTNERLLCIELCKPRTEFEDASGKLGYIVRNDHGGWHRSHPIAVVNSSDCKRLDPDDGTGDEGWIGKRHTWIKMSRPSIEGLRQAFLDHESRIGFGLTRPEDLQRHDRIERILVSGVDFLADQEIELSPNLNAFIGGGGTGKSTILEYIRGLVGRPPTTAAEVASSHEGAFSTIGAGTVEIHLRQGEETLVVTSGDHRDQSHLPNRFPVVAFSQREVFDVAASEPATLALIDGLRRDRLDELARAEARERDTLRTLDGEIDALVELESQSKVVSAELERLTSVLKTVEEQQQPLALLNQHRREAEAVERLDADLERVAVQIENFAGTLALDTDLFSARFTDTPHAGPVSALHDRARLAVAQAADTVAAVAVGLRDTAKAETHHAEREGWRVALDCADKEYRALREASGDDAEEEPELLRQQVDARVGEMAGLNKRVEALRERAAVRPNALASLRSVWTLQIAARQEIADTLKDLVPATATGDPYVEVEIRPFADTTPLRQKLNEWVHGQALSDIEAAQMCERALKDANGGNPVDIVVGWIRDLAQGTTPPALKEIDLRPVACARIGQKVTPTRIRELERLRLPDKALVQLRRHDGTLAGSLDKGLSVGQRCTAIIALALAAGREPILIDQPEDEIDNEFIYTELVPLLRKAKNQRQVIIATHNPNLPVNGDAELIYALETRGLDGGVRAFPKAMGNDQAIGSLDRPSVKAAVEIVMEGNKEAFNRRRARYGF